MRRYFRQEDYRRRDLRAGHSAAATIVVIMKEEKVSGVPSVGDDRSAILLGLLLRVFFTNLLRIGKTDTPCGTDEPVNGRTKSSHRR